MPIFTPELLLKLVLLFLTRSLTAIAIFSCQIGALNRQKLGQIIFNNPQERQWLEQQIHPYVRDRFVTAIKELSAQTVVLVVPLLFELE
jgi:dephospho-CoA kinase